MKKNPVPIVQNNYTDNSPVFSDFYELVTRLFLTKDGDSPKLITVTSAIKGEGKSTIISFMAQTFALVSQEHILLVDGDMRRPSLHKRFGVKNEKGLSDALLETVNVSDTLQKVALPNLHLLTAGKHVNNPMHLLSRAKSKQLFNKLSFHYRMILIDSPPAIPVRDSIRLAHLSDGVILVIRAGKTSKYVVRRAVQLLQDSYCNLYGIVLNDIGQVLPYYYQHKYYRYDYNHEE